MKRQECSRTFRRQINLIYQQFEKDDDTAGGITIFVFDNSELAMLAYNEIWDGMGNDPGDKGIGEQSSVSAMSLFGTGEKFHRHLVYAMQLGCTFPHECPC